MMKYDEECRNKALQLNYQLGHYSYKYCENCGALIEEYSLIKYGLCFECFQESDTNYSQGAFVEYNF